MGEEDARQTSASTDVDASAYDEEDALRPAGWFETEAEEQERLEREVEWTSTEEGGVLVVGHNPPALVTRPMDWPRS